MADHPAHEQPKKADPALAQYVVNLTPEQHEAALKAARDADTPRPQMEMGGSGTATVSFTDAAGAAVVVTSADWTATGPVVVTPDEANPLSAKLVPTGLGPATVTATGHAETGSAQAHAEVMVIEKVGGPIAGEIVITVAPPAPPDPPPAP